MVSAATLVSLRGDRCVTLDESSVREATGADPVYRMLLARVRIGNGHEHRTQEAPCMRPFFTVRDRLSVVDVIVIYTFDK